ncbi:universal stress protein [Streptomyces sp. KLOTTS4A1]|uniref:universal stress protein n=1 Tax=Streptomyces sp. KLOTTS4A1 TaxID=3390996 RepID=UPI0039F48E3E
MTPIGQRPVVFGVDSAQQDAALHWALDEAARRGAPLHLVHAGPTDAPTTPSDPMRGESRSRP